MTLPPSAPLPKNFFSPLVLQDLQSSRALKDFWKKLPIYKAGISRSGAGGEVFGTGIATAILRQ